MSRYPPQGYYPPSIPYQSHYASPDHPIPYRGHPTSNPQSPTSAMSQASASTAKQDDVDDSTLEDGGWGSRAGPLIIDRQRAAARRGRQTGHRGMNSFDKTAVWLRTSQSGSSSMSTAPEQVRSLLPLVTLINADIVSRQPRLRLPRCRAQKPLSQLFFL
jgi:hypothetical protein